jgi:hypothetical protein
MKTLTLEQHKTIARKLEMIKSLQWDIKEILESSGFRKSNYLLVKWRNWERSKNEKEIKNFLDNLFCKDHPESIEKLGFIYYRADFIP